jgi:hypothetical protein
MLSLVRGIVAAIWSLAAVGKLVSPKYTFHQFNVLLPFSSALVTACICFIVLVQLLIPFLILRKRPLGSFIGTGLSLSLLMFEVARLRKGGTGPCGCFGELVQIPPVTSLLVTAALFGLSMFLSLDVIKQIASETDQQTQ